MRRKRMLMAVLLSVAGAGLSVPAPAGGAETVHLECEAFETWGGWVNDTQFMDQMGSPYLLAHGMGTPVENAKTAFSIEREGVYYVTARTKNWTAPWSKSAAGRFRILIDGSPLPTELGAAGEGAWTVEVAGKVFLSKGRHALELRDLTGFDGRCDWVEIKRGLSDVASPPVSCARHCTNDLVVVGGGIAGITAAISAARLGLTVALVQDRPVLGGNNSSEVRVHLGAWQNKAPYPRLGDVVAEIGPRLGGNAQPKEVYEDDRKLAVVKAERNISLCLNTRANAVLKSAEGAIAAVAGVDTRTGERTVFSGRWFVDATGDGTIGFLSGADYRMGREAKSETGEAWAPEKADGLTMGASVQWYAGPTKDGRASAFPCRPWMLAFTDENAHFDLRGDWDWEAGLGRDQIREAEYIRDYGLLVAYSNWAFVKNRSKRVAEFATSELKWVAYNAGRRESRRLLGDYVLSENDIDARTVFNDGTCATTWTIDLHWPMTAAETKFAGEPFRSDSRNKVIWPIAIPYRCCYSRNIANLFMAGRNISVTHIALGTTRLMRTHGMMGEVVGMAASLCKKHDCMPRQVYARHLDELKGLMERGVGDGRGHPAQMYNIQASRDPAFSPQKASNGQILKEDESPGVQKMSLAGEWRFAPGVTNAFEDAIVLPTTTDLAGKGGGGRDALRKEAIHPQLLGADMVDALTMHPVRRHPFVGVAKYEREIDVPDSWRTKRLSLFLERTKLVRAFLDGVEFGSSDTLAAPAVMCLPDGVTPGRHVLRLEVDNRLDGRPFSGHQVSDDTQTNWNGILGRLELRAEDGERFGRVRLFPKPDERAVDVEAEVISPVGVVTNRQTVVLPADAALWSEFTPVLHEIEVRVGGLVRRMKVGLRTFRTKGTQFTVNGRPTFLRGRHDACVWPLTGAAPMEVGPWRAYFKTLKEYGLNHVRFHSWCPPEAAFQAADELGFYLQPELPFFGGDWKKPEVCAYAASEAERVLDAYGNHPSFVMFSLANEPRTGGEARERIVRALRAYDPRPLYAQGSNADFDRPHAFGGDDFWCTFRSAEGAEGNVRGSYSHADLPLGAVQLPGGGTLRDFSSAVRHASVPLVGHEVGQYQVYPDYSEIAKWTGPLRPANLEVFRERLKGTGMAGQAEGFFRASGALAVRNYREDIEEALRTPGFGGFQLLDIQDFPGQGTALVGILDAFMAPKGLIEPAEWRGFCSPTVLLARFPKYTYEAGEPFAARLQVAHYGAEDSLEGTFAWRCLDAERAVVASGTFPFAAPVGTVTTVGDASLVLPKAERPAQYTLELTLAGRPERNAYPLWVYPPSQTASPKDVAVVNSLAEGNRLLAEGRKVLCVLSRANAPTNAIPGAFAADFWNWQMFGHVCRSLGRPIAPGTLGLLVDAKHPALAGFPTAAHSDFQWRELLFHGVNVVLDEDPARNVIVQGIDNVTRSQRLGVIWEKRAKGGCLLVSAIDLDACADLPESRALKQSLLRYLSEMQPISEIVSPNGRVSCAVELRKGIPVARVSYDGRFAFDSELGFRMDALALEGLSTQVVRKSWKPVWGFRSEYPENYAEATVRLVSHTDVGMGETLVLRCYDEGFAVRAETVKNVYELSEVRDERTSWRLADGAKAWCVSETEGTFPEEPCALTGLEGGKPWRMPFTVELSPDCSLSILEANVRDYPRSFLSASNGVIRPVFAIGVKEGRGRFCSPWRAVQLAPNAGRLIETAYFIENLNDPCAVGDASWLRPGLTVSDAGNCELVTEQVIDAARAAHRLGARHFQLDWGWYGTEYPWSDNDRAVFRARHPEFAEDGTWERNTHANPYAAAKGTVPYHPWWPYDCHRRGVDLDIPKVAAELKKMGMGLGLYVHGAVLEANDLDSLFATYASWGVSSLKPGFVSYGSQRATEWMRSLAATAAKHRLWLDIHDAHIPDGFERTYPNVMIAEGGGGEEGDHPARQDVALPFTRCLSGPFDFTPRLFNPNGAKQGTKAHEVALFLCYPGPTAVMRGDVRKLLETDSPLMAFLKALPWNYDETHVLDAAIARHLVVVRRKGESWYLAGLSGESEHTPEVSFDFLPEGLPFTLRLWRDDFASESRPRGYVRETRCVRKGDSLAVPMARCGGFLALIERPSE